MARADRLTEQNMFCSSAWRIEEFSILGVFCLCWVHCVMLSVSTHQNSRPNSRFIKTYLLPAPERSIMKSQCEEQKVSEYAKKWVALVSTFLALAWGRMSSFISTDVTSTLVCLLSPVSDPLASPWLPTDVANFSLSSFGKREVFLQQGWDKEPRLV